MEAAAGTRGTPELTAANLLKQARLHQSESRNLMRQITESSKGMKATRKKTQVLSNAKLPRKTSDGQMRWQAFQQFIWAKMQKTNPRAPFKNAMAASGPLWVAGNPITEEVSAEFEEYLKEHPVPSAEEQMVARQEKLKAAGIDANRLEQRELSRLTYFEKTLLTKMNDINDNVIRLIETLSTIEGGYRNNTRKHIRKNNKSRKQYK